MHHDIANFRDPSRDMPSITGSQGRCARLRCAVPAQHSHAMLYPQVELLSARNHAPAARYTATWTLADMEANYEISNYHWLG
jgi:hypothetical protein